MNEEIPEVFNGQDAVSNMLREIVRVEGVSVEFAYPYILGALSCAAGRGLQVQSFRGKFSRPNLFMIHEAPSCSGKSSVGNAVFKPLFDLDLEMRQRFLEDEGAKLKANIRYIEAKLKHLEKSEFVNPREIEKLLSVKAKSEASLGGPRLIVEDFTSEALVCNLSQQEGRLSVISTDARAVFKNLLGRHRNGQTEEHVYISAWSGDPITVDRVTRASIPPILNPCLSVFLAIQPDLFRDLIRSDFLESGFFARCLFASGLDDSPRSALGAEYNPVVVSHYHEFLREVASFYRPVKKPFDFRMSAEARGYLERFFYEAENLTQKDPSFALCYRRWAEQACRIAVCLQVAFFGRQAHTHDLHPYCASKAVELVKWFGARQTELIADIVQTTEERHRDKLIELVHANGGSVTLRMAYKKIGSSRNVLVKIVSDHPQLEIVHKGGTGGRPSDTIVLTPATNL